MLVLDRVICATGTLDALLWMMLGGVMPGGIARSDVLDEAAICAIALPISVPGWK